ncbi:MAG: hypothetical protein KAS30_04080 [Candidatus Diapherotrites archaeon]|nr:hypothetical protein [Candidatus Diapherotrites archaeon]
MDKKTTILLISALIGGIYLGSILAGLLIEADPLKLGKGSPHDFFLRALKAPDEVHIAGPFLLQEGDRICEIEFVSDLDISLSSIDFVYDGDLEFAQVVGSDNESRGHCLRGNEQMNYLAQIRCTINQECQIIFYPRTDL